MDEMMKSGQELPDWLAMLTKGLGEKVRACTFELASANERLQQEVDERRNAEAELRRSEEMYASIFSCIGIGIALVGPDMRLRSINQTTRDQYPDIDISQHPLCYDSFYDPPRGEVCPHCPVVPAFRDGTRHVTTIDVAMGGEMRTFRITASPIVAADGTIPSVIETVEEITAEKRAEAVLEEEATRRRILFEEARDGIVVLDEDGRVVEANPGFAAMLGYAPEEMQDLHVGDWDVRWTRAELEKMLCGTDPTGLYVTRHRRRDGTERDVEVNTSIAVWRGQRLLFCSCRDVTDRVRAQEELRQLNAELELRVGERTAELEAGTREMEGFCHAISHELRGSIARLEGFSGVLAESVAAGDQGGILYCAERIAVSSQQLRSVIDALLTINRLSRAELKAGWVDLSALARRVARELCDGSETAAVQLKIAPDIRVWGDMNMLEICLQNLLGNAFKYTARIADPAVEVGTACRDGRTVFFVRDNGAGFDMAHADRLFLPFSRLHCETEFAGNGVGLAIVHRIIERHGGKIWGEATPGNGATFYVALGLEPVVGGMS